MATHFRALWAVDAVPEHKELQMKTGLALKALLSSLDADVQPVTVISPDQTGLFEDFLHHHVKDRRPEIEERLTAWSREVGFSNLLAPEILVQDQFSISRSSACLREYARKAGANLIALGTSGKRGLTRAMMGSFAESVALESETPLFVVSPHTHPPANIRQVLFPTDFSPSCRQALDRLLPVAAAKSARIVFFYKLEYLAPHTREVVETYPPYKKFMEQDVAQRERIAAEWKTLAEAQGVQAEIVFDRTTNYVVDSILETAARMEDGMIAMASQRGKASIVLGSITRDIIRSATIPVWVIHPH